MVYWAAIRRRARFESMSENEPKQKEIIQVYDSLNQQLTDCIHEKKRKDEIIAQLTQNFPEIDPADLEQYINHNLAGQSKTDRINSSRQFFRGVFWSIIGVTIFSLIYFSPLAKHETVRQLLGHQIKLSPVGGVSESSTSTISFLLVLIAVAIAWGIVSFAHGIYLYLRRL